MQPVKHNNLVRIEGQSSFRYVGKFQGLLNEDKIGTKSKRTEVLKEILTTEIQYVEQLKTLLDSFVKPIKAEKMIEDPDEVFLNIEAIVTLHENLLEAFEKTIPGIEEINDNTMFGTAFLQFSSWLKIYSAYIQGYEKGLECLKKARHDNPELDLMLKDQKTNCGGLGLEDYLIKPVQRICKYPLLLRELLSSTPENHSDYPVVKKTFDAVQSVAELGNRFAAEELNFQKICKFNETVSGYEANPSLDWLYTEEILIEKNKNQKLHVYLMSNSIIITKPIKQTLVEKEKKKEKKEKFVAKYHLNIVEANFNVDSEEISFDMVIKESEETIIYRFICPSNASKINWRNNLADPKNKTEVRRPQNAFFVIDSNEVSKDKMEKAISNRKKKRAKSINNPKLPSRSQTVREPHPHIKKIPSNEPKTPPPHRSCEEGIIPKITFDESVSNNQTNHHDINNNASPRKKKITGQIKDLYSNVHQEVKILTKIGRSISSGGKTVKSKNKDYQYTQLNDDSPTGSPGPRYGGKVFKIWLEGYFFKVIPYDPDMNLKSILSKLSQQRELNNCEAAYIDGEVLEDTDLPLKSLREDAIQFVNIHKKLNPTIVNDMSKDSLSSFKHVI